MKKILMCIVAATLCVSAWGTEVSVTIPTSGATTTQDFPFTLSHPNGSLTTKVYRSKTQQIFLVNEIGATNAGIIKSISFKSSNYSTTNTSFSDTRRKLTVYLQETDLTSLSSFVDYSNATQIFSADKFEIVSGATFSFNNFEFNWSGTKHILITIIDNTEQTATATTNNKNFVGYTPTTNSRGIAQTFDYSGDACAPYSTPTVLNTIAQITFTIDASGSTTPSLTATSDITNFGTFAKEYETKPATITVTGENLTEDVAISAGTGLSVAPTSLTKEAVMAQGGATVTVTTTADFVSGSKVTISGNDIEKKITLSGTQATFETKISVQQLANTSDGSYSSLAGPTEIKSVDNSTNTFVIGSGSYACTIDYSAVPGTYVALGKVSNLKVKKTGTGTFKAFAFDYSVSGITISEINERNNIIYGTVTNVTLKRTLVADGYYSTICLPFAVTAEQIADQFGEGTKVQDLTEATLSDDDMTLTLTFTEVEAMEAGKPYLILPTEGGSEFAFNNVTLTNEVEPIEFANLQFIGTFNQSTLETGFKNTLLLGGNNELGWANNSGTFKGLRAYFRVIYHSNQAPERLSARMLFNNTQTTTNLIGIKGNQPTAKKILLSNRLYIINNGKKYNTLGLETK